jgi:hypothetical protein
MQPMLKRAIVVILVASAGVAAGAPSIGSMVGAGVGGAIIGYVIAWQLWDARTDADAVTTPD